MMSNLDQISEVTNDSRSDWLSLKEASTYLGIHYTTLRTWADEGKLKTFRTPGGHRRFQREDLDRFLTKYGQLSLLSSPEGVFETVVGQVRAEIENAPEAITEWHYQLAGNEVEVRRERGRQLFRLAVLYVMKKSQREQLLAQGKLLGCEYGREAALKEVGLVDTGRAVQFFRGQLQRSIRGEETAHQDSDDIQIQMAIDQFFDEVLYAVLSGYEQVIKERSSG